MAITGKSHQADAVAFKAIDQPLNFKTCAIQPIGFNILGQHTQRRIQNNHQIDAPTMDQFQFGAELRLYQCQNQKNKPDTHQRGFYALPHATDTRSEFIHQLGSTKRIQRPALASKCPPVKKRENRHAQKEIKSLWIAKPHLRQPPKSRIAQHQFQ